MQIYLVQRSYPYIGIIEKSYIYEHEFRFITIKLVYLYKFFFLIRVQQSQWRIHKKNTGWRCNHNKLILVL